MAENIELLADMRERVGDDFWLMYDCWMSLDVDYATRLAHRAHDYGLRWLEEALIPDDYWGYQQLRRNVPPGMLITTGEHEAKSGRASGRERGEAPAGGVARECTGSEVGEA